MSQTPDTNTITGPGSTTTASTTLNGVNLPAALGISDTTGRLAKPLPTYNSAGTLNPRPDSIIFGSAGTIPKPSTSMNHWDPISASQPFAQPGWTSSYSTPTSSSTGSTTTDQTGSLTDIIAGIINSGMFSRKGM